MFKDYIIIGAGLSGLNTASKIHQFKLGSVLVLDKARGVGGRMATRRTLETKFDHGAQFYRLKPEITELHHLWEDKNINRQWFISAKGNHWCAPSGMTALPKALAENLGVQLSVQIQTILFENQHWKLISDKGEEWTCKNLIMTSPLPQTIKLLEGVSGESFIDQTILAGIKTIQYTKALIGLVALEEDLPMESSGYLEFEGGDFFSITDQKRKGISDCPAVTLTMSPQFSEIEFDQPDEISLEKILKAFLRQYPQARVKAAELKKWRYCQPISRYDSMFAEIAPNLFLVGDAFGGSSLLGAVRSSETLGNHFAKRKSAEEI